MTIGLAQTNDERAAVLQYIARRLETDPSDLVGPFRYEAFGIVKDGQGIGGVVLTLFRSGDAEIFCAGERGWVSRRVLKAVFGCAFKAWGLRRLTTATHPEHKISRQLAEGLGFKVEGVKRQGWGNGADAILYGLTADECRWT